MKRQTSMGSGATETIPPPNAIDDDDDYDDEKDHERCPDCRGSGFYVGFLERSYCETCDGSGFL